MLMEHNPEIDWHMGDISMMRCLELCRLKTVEEEDQLNCIPADKTQKQSKAHLHCQVNVEEAQNVILHMTKLSPHQGSHALIWMDYTRMTGSSFGS